MSLFPRSLKSLPDLIWVESIRNNFLILAVYRPVGRRFSRRKNVEITFTDGPLVYETEAERMALTEELIDSGRIICEGEGRTYGIVTSLPEARAFMESHWGVARVEPWARPAPTSKHPSSETV